MSIANQGLCFLLVGCGLIAADWVVFVDSSVLGMPPAWAKVTGRVRGALPSFAANSGITFREAVGARYGVHRFAQVVVLWRRVNAAEHRTGHGLGGSSESVRVAWLAKRIVEAGLAAVSFFASRHWVYF